MKPFKVVCVDDTHWHLTTGSIPEKCSDPIRGEIYTVTYSKVIHDDKLVYLIPECSPTVYYYSKWFRPVQDIGDSVEEHINKLIKEEDLKTISV